MAGMEAQVHYMTEVTGFFDRVDWMVLFGIVLVVGSITIFVRMTRDKRSTFDFAEMFRDESGNTSMSKFSAFLGTLASTWVVIAYAAAKELTDTIFVGYLTVLVVGKVASEFVAAKKLEASDKARMGIGDPPPAPQIIVQNAGMATVPAADALARGSPEKPLHVEIEDGDAAKPQGTARRPLGKRGGPTKG